MLISPKKNQQILAGLCVGKAGIRKQQLPENYNQYLYYMIQFAFIRYVSHDSIFNSLQL